MLLDVTPLSLGIATLGGVMTRLIERNTTIPKRESQIFSTAADNQASVEIHVLQGEREMAPDNRTLGRFNLEGIPAAPRGIPQIEVTFDIDANGILSVKAKELGSNREQQITITGTGGLDQGDIDRMVQDVEHYTQANSARLKLVETRNQLDSLIFQTEKQLREDPSMLPDDVSVVVTALREAKKARSGTALVEMERARDNLANKLT